jgi:hypothetical protein
MPGVRQSNLSHVHETEGMVSRMADGQRDMITLVCVSHPSVSHSKVRIARVTDKASEPYMGKLIRRDEHPMGIDDFRAVPRVGSNHASPEKHIEIPVVSAERTFF